MIDVDHFKRVNDEFGHVTGDHVLRELARRLAAGIREGDLLARYGGEELALLLPDTDLAAALELCERLRAEVAATSFESHRGPVPVTVSVGVSAFRDDVTGAALVDRADGQLYTAKSSGRDRVVG